MQDSSVTLKSEMGVIFFNSREIKAMITGVIIVFFCFFPWFSVFSCDSPSNVQRWFDKLSSASQHLNYSGVVVYNRKNHMNAMRLVHLSKVDGDYESLVSLDDPEGKVIRSKNNVHCKLPNSSPVVFSKVETGANSGKKMLSKVASSKQYCISIMGERMVSGRQTQLIDIKAKDQYRYGYRIWVDQKNGLLLKSQLRDNKGTVIEQMMFTSIDFGMPEIDLTKKPVAEIKKAQQIIEQPKQLRDRFKWLVNKPPQGFFLIKNRPRQSGNYHHMIFSDGLASVSIFIEDAQTAPTFVGNSQLGAVNAFGSVVSGHPVTVVGEVPSATLKTFRDNIVLTEYQH